MQQKKSKKEKKLKKRGMGESDTYIKREYLGIMGAYDTESQVYKGFHFYRLTEKTLHRHIFLLAWTLVE